MAARVVVVVGAAGMLGRHVVGALAAHDGVVVRGTHRPGKSEAARTIADAGGVPVEADLSAPEALDAAVDGAHVVISTVQGEKEIIVDGQRALLTAAERAGVARMIPSDYSVDLFRLDDGDNVNSDLRRAFARIIQDSPVRPTAVLNGAFTDVAVSPWLGLVDRDARTFSYWGDGDQPCDFTTIADTARYIAAAALDDDLTGRPLRVAGEVLTMLELHDAFQDGTGIALDARRLGSVDALAARIAELVQQDAPVNDYLGLQYAWTMVSGKGKLDPLDNDRYPDIVPTSVTQFLRTQPAPAATS